MGMTSDEAIETIKGNRWIACSEKYQEAMNAMENTMHKYEKIEDIIKNWKDTTIEEKDSIYAFHKIMEIVEDGNTN